MANFNCVGGRFFFVGKLATDGLLMFRIVVVSIMLTFWTMTSLRVDVICLASVIEQPNLWLLLLIFGTQAGANVDIIFDGVEIDYNDNMLLYSTFACT